MRIGVVGPTYPYRGGIAHYTTLLVHHLRQAEHRAPLYSFTRQYPRWLFPGKTDRDPSTTPLRVDCEYILDPINPLTWLRLVRRVRADQLDLLVLQWWVPYWTPSLATIARLIKRSTNLKIVFICHNVVPHDGGGVLDRRLALTVLRQGDALIVHSEQDRHRLMALLPQAHIVKAAIPTYAPLAHQGASAPERDLRRQLGLPEDAPVLLFFGFVRPYKGLEYLIQAMPHIRARLPAHLLVVGEFWSSREFYARYAKEFGVEPYITFIDRYVPNEELPSFFGLSDVVVLPYVSATQSAVVQLAFGFNKPVITTRVGGLHEVVHDGVNGLIVPPQDELALADAVVRFFNDEVGAQIRARVSTGAAVNTYTWNDLVRALENLAQTLTRGPERGG
ncbi:MAG: glycosyltransferase [Chloroflexaceae bacterium]|nr:glycosyltransferase [Chloroflexaceae bacterium]